MDFNLLYAILIALVPVVVTIIFSKVYNIFHGLFTFLTFSFLLCFLFTHFGSSLPVELAAQLELVLGTYVYINTFVLDSLKLIGLESLLTASYGEYILLGIYVVIFIVSQIIASVLRKKRVEKIKGLKRSVKRY